MLNTINNLLWGPGTLALLLGTGLFLTIRMRFLPWRRLPFALQAVRVRAKAEPLPNYMMFFSSGSASVLINSPQGMTIR